MYECVCVCVVSRSRTWYMQYLASYFLPFYLCIAFRHFRSFIHFIRYSVRLAYHHRRWKRMHKDFRFSMYSIVLVPTVFGRIGI